MHYSPPIPPSLAFKSNQLENNDSAQIWNSINLHLEKFTKKESLQQKQFTEQILKKTSSKFFFIMGRIRNSQLKKRK